MGKTIGIDLGTTNSCVVVLEGEVPTVITNGEGGRTTPSAVGFTKTGERVIGAAAKRQAVVTPDRTVLSIKRKMGTSEKVTLNGTAYTPEEISAMILQRLKADAESYLNEPVDTAVITVPAYFDNAQRTATKNAGAIAGLNVTRIINEPTAAALAYGLDKKENETILVFDLGGGTFDVSILEVGQGVCEVKSTNGDTHLGGDDWDTVIINYILAEFKKETDIDLSGDRQAMQRIRAAAERAKIDLSNVQQCNINEPFIAQSSEGAVNLDINLTRARFEDLSRNLVERCTIPFKKAIADAKIKDTEIDQIVLVGGSTRMPMIQDLVRKLGGGKEPHKGVNPDEVVAVGAAIQGGVLSGAITDVVLVDVTPLSLGIETLNGKMTRLIERNTPIPARVSKMFTTAEDFQTAVEIQVFQGERDLVVHNKRLGTFQLTGIAPASKGVPQIDVAFALDSNGILNVTAKDRATQREQSIRIDSSSSLTEAEIKQMVEDAKRHAAEDQKALERANARNQGDAVLVAIERSLNETGASYPDAERQALETALEVLRDALRGNDPDAILEGTKTVMGAQDRAIQAMLHAQDVAAFADDVPPPTSDNTPEDVETEVL